jgi:hypothetical protein
MPQPFAASSAAISSLYPDVHRLASARTRVRPVRRSICSSNWRSAASRSADKATSLAGSLPYSRAAHAVTTASRCLSPSGSSRSSNTPLIRHLPARAAGAEAPGTTPAGLPRQSPTMKLPEAPGTPVRNHNQHQATCWCAGAAGRPPQSAAVLPARARASADPPRPAPHAASTGARATRPPACRSSSSAALRLGPGRSHWDARLAIFAGATRAARTVSRRRAGGAVASTTHRPAQPASACPLACASLLAPATAPAPGSEPTTGQYPHSRSPPHALEHAIGEPRRHAPRTDLDRVGPHQPVPEAAVVACRDQVRQHATRGPPILAR